MLIATELYRGTQGDSPGITYYMNGFELGGRRPEKGLLTGLCYYGDEIRLLTTLCYQLALLGGEVGLRRDYSPGCMYNLFNEFHGCIQLFISPHSTALWVRSNYQ